MKVMLQGVTFFLLKKGLDMMFPFASMEGNWFGGL